jgi:predicted metal-dependent peptidase
VFNSLDDKQRGNMPSSLIEKIKALLAPPAINWKQILRKMIGSVPVPHRKTRRRLNRRQPERGDLSGRLPRRIVDIVVAIDTSGSTLGDRSKFLSELNGLVESFGDYELSIITCDCEVNSCEMYSRDNPLDIKNSGFMLEGGGGTSFNPPFDYILDHQIEADVMIYLTDGYGEVYRDNPIGLPVMWVICKDGNEDFCDWGEKIKLNSSGHDEY